MHPVPAVPTWPANQVHAAGPTSHGPRRQISPAFVLMRDVWADRVYILWTVHNLAHSPWDSQNARRRRRDHAAAAAVKALMLLQRTGLALRSATALLPMTS
jgi:hypothetical protein